MTREDMGPLPEVSSRQVGFQKANADLFSVMIDWQERNKGMTSAEMLATVTGWLNARLLSMVVKERIQ